MYRPLADDGIVRRLIGAAGAAPSIHNTQPWRFRVAGHDSALSTLSRRLTGTLVRAPGPARAPRGEGPAGSRAMGPGRPRVRPMVWRQTRGGVACTL